MSNSSNIFWIRGNFSDVILISQVKWYYLGCAILESLFNISFPHKQHLKLFEIWIFRIDKFFKFKLILIFKLKFDSFESILYRYRYNYKERRWYRLIPRVDWQTVIINNPAYTTIQKHPKYSKIFLILTTFKISIFVMSTNLVRRFLQNFNLAIWDRNQLYPR